VGTWAHCGFSLFSSPEGNEKRKQTGSTTPTPCRPPSYARCLIRARRATPCYLTPTRPRSHVRRDGCQEHRGTGAVVLGSAEYRRAGCATARDISVRSRNRICDFIREMAWGRDSLRAQEGAIAMRFWPHLASFWPDPRRVLSKAPLCHFSPLATVPRGDDYEVQVVGRGMPAAASQPVNPA
jgi:hypothetical protein